MNGIRLDVLFHKGLLFHILPLMHLSKGVKNEHFRGRSLGLNLRSATYWLGKYPNDLSVANCKMGILVIGVVHKSSARGSLTVRRAQSPFWGL